MKTVINTTSEPVSITLLPGEVAEVRSMQEHKERGSVATYSVLDELPFYEAGREPAHPDRMDGVHPIGTFCQPDYEAYWKANSLDGQRVALGMLESADVPTVAPETSPEAESFLGRAFTPENIANAYRVLAVPELRDKVAALWEASKVDLFAEEIEAERIASVTRGLCK